MDQIRVTFVIVLAILLTGAGTAAFVSRSTPAGPQTEQSPTAIAAATVDLPVPPPVRERVVIPRATTEQIQPSPTAPAAALNFEPIFAADAPAALPAFVCGANAPGSHLTLVHIQRSGLDIRHGFKLGIVPFGLNASYRASEAERAHLLTSGALDCSVTSLHAMALHGPGVITALAGESTLAQQLWTRDIESLAELSGKRIAYESGGASEALVRTLVNTLRLPPNAPGGVQLLPQATFDDALRAFNSGQADAVAGWEPAILDAAQSGAQPLDESRGLHQNIDVLALSRHAAAVKRELAGQFHQAWFESIADQAADLDSAASLVAAWGNSPWTGISTQDASDDWRLHTQTVEQANLARNQELFKRPDTLIAHLNEARQDWARFALDRPAWDNTDLTDGSFVAAVAATAAKHTSQSSALITDADAVDAPIAPQVTRGPVTLTVLPCRRFEFMADTLELAETMRSELDACVLAAMQASPRLVLTVRASSAWPGPAGTYSRAQIEEAARARARSIVNYLVSKGIDRKRFVIKTLLPPPARRESEDVLIQARDRFVELTLLAPGL
jgi:ABC-type nitrate/sulfonate/bicarbonate transport system substrate-binding protein